MREAIGGTWLFQIVIVLILFFVGYLCLSVNHSKAFNVKNSIINAIEIEEGIDLANPENDPAIKKIVEYIKNSAYRTTGNCPTDYTGINRDGKIDSRSSAICIKKEQASNYSDLPEMNYYRIIVFYKLDLPIFNNVFSFQVTGDTKVMAN